MAEEKRFSSPREPSNSAIKEFEKAYQNLSPSAPVSDVKKLLSTASTICDSPDTAKNLAAIIIRNDKLKSKLPFERLVDCLSRDLETEIPILALDLILKFILKLPPNESEFFWRALEKTNLATKLHSFINQNNKQMKSLLVKIQNLTLSKMKKDHSTLYDPRNPIHDELLQRLFKLSEPLTCYNNEIFWRDVDIFTLKNIIYFSETYSQYYQQILSERQRLGDNCYSLPSVAVSLSQTLLDNFLVQDEASESEPKLFDILFDTGHASREIFAIELVLFDRHWIEKGTSLQHVPEILETLKSLVAKQLSQNKEMVSLRNALGVTKYLKKIPNASLSVITSQIAHRTLSSTTIVETDKSPLVSSASTLSSHDHLTLLKNKFLEYERELTNPYNDNPIVSLTSIRDITCDPQFSWNLVSRDLLQFIIGTLPEWQRQLQAQPAVLALKFLRRYIKKHPQGCVNLIETLQHSTLTTEEDQASASSSKFRPLTKMLRHNKTFLPGLKLINDIVALTAKQSKIALIVDLIQSDILKIISSKVWIDDEEAKLQLAYFQYQLINVENEPFDPQNPQHREMIPKIWLAAFPHLKLSQLGADQFEILGFHNIKSINDFKGRHTLSLKSLCYFAEQHNHFFRVLIGQWVSEPFRATSYFPIGDIALRIADMLIEKFSRVEKEKLERKIQKKNVSSSSVSFSSSISPNRVADSLTASASKNNSEPLLSSNYNSQSSLLICPPVFDDIKAFKDIYCVAMLAYDRKWLEKSSSSPVVLSTSSSRAFLGVASASLSNVTASTRQSPGLKIAVNIIDQLSKDLDSVFEKKPPTIGDFAALMNVQLKPEELALFSVSTNNILNKAVAQNDRGLSEQSSPSSTRTKSDEDLMLRTSVLSSDYVEQYIEAHSEELIKRGIALAEKILKECDENKQKQTTRKRTEKQRTTTVAGSVSNPLIRRSSSRTTDQRKQKNFPSHSKLKLKGLREGRSSKRSSSNTEKDKTKEGDKEKQKEALRQREREIKEQQEQKEIYMKHQKEQEMFFSDVTKRIDEKG